MTCNHLMRSELILLLFWITAFLFVQPSNLYAHPEEVNFEHLSGKEGRSQGYITSIVQDSLGFIWVGTQDGLNKYDGYKFTVYYHSEIDSTTISDNWVKSIVIDKDQNITLIPQLRVAGEFKKMVKTFF